MVKDGDTIFIGGLVKESTISVDKKIPILGDIMGDIPILGGLFKRKGMDKEKTELVFFITVHIVKSFADIRKIIERGLTETKIPDDILKEEVKAMETGEVFVELPAGASPETEKSVKAPLFDFRRKK